MRAVARTKHKPDRGFPGYAMVAPKMRPWVFAGRAIHNFCFFNHLDRDVARCETPLERRNLPMWQTPPQESKLVLCQYDRPALRLRVVEGIRALSIMLAGFQQVLAFSACQAAHAISADFFQDFIHALLIHILAPGVRTPRWKQALPPRAAAPESGISHEKKPERRSAEMSERCDSRSALDALKEIDRHEKQHQVFRFHGENEHEQKTRVGIEHGEDNQHAHNARRRSDHRRGWHEKTMGDAARDSAPQEQVGESPRADHSFHIRPHEAEAEHVEQQMKKPMRIVQEDVGRRLPNEKAVKKSAGREREVVQEPRAAFCAQDLLKQPHEDARDDERFGHHGGMGARLPARFVVSSVGPSHFNESVTPRSALVRERRRAGQPFQRPTRLAARQ